MPNTVAEPGRGDADGRTTRWDSHKAQRRHLILESAIDAINEFGPDVGVNDIATRAQLPRSVVYRVFSDRGDLDEQLRARIVDKLMESLTPTLALQGPVGDAIARIVYTYVGWIVEFPRLHQFLGRGSPSRRTAGSRVVATTRTAIALLLAGLLRSALDRQSSPAELVDPLAFGLVGFVDASVNRWLNSPNSTVSADELSEFLTVSIWQLLEGNFRRFGVAVERSTSITDLA